MAHNLIDPYLRGSDIETISSFTSFNDFITDTSNEQDIYNSDFLSNATNTEYSYTEDTITESNENGKSDFIKGTIKPPPLYVGNINENAIFERTYNLDLEKKKSEYFDKKLYQILFNRLILNDNKFKLKK